MRFFLILFSMFVFCGIGYAQVPQNTNINIGFVYQPYVGYIITNQSTNFILSKIFFTGCQDNKSHKVSFNENYIKDMSVFEYGLSSCERINLIDKNNKSKIIPLTEYKNDIINFQREVDSSVLSTSETFIKK